MGTEVSRYEEKWSNIRGALVERFCKVAMQGDSFEGGGKPFRRRPYQEAGTRIFFEVDVMLLSVGGGGTSIGGAYITNLGQNRHVIVVVIVVDNLRPRVNLW